MNTWEVASMALSGASLYYYVADSAFQAYATTFHLTPDLEAGVSGPGPHTVTTFGGSNLGNSFDAAARVLKDVSTIANKGAGMASVMGSYQRRQEDWDFQRDLAIKELEQIGKEELIAQFRKEIACQDLVIHEKSIEQSEEAYEFYQDKFTNLGLYSWLSNELNKLYRQAYNLAYETARMAEQAYHFERDDDTVFIQPGHWESQKAGLLAGERLMMQLQQMDKAYLETYERNFEVDQAFSLLQFNPNALIQLREKGKCEFSIPEFLFDLAYPGQYRRKIKSVRLTIPCVTGPYTNVSAKLTLVESKIRLNADIDEEPVSVPRSRNVSIATSTAQNDGGQFNLTFDGARYMPYEGAGAISTWRLELPAHFRAFDYDSISDVIIHVSYTAKDSGTLRAEVENQLVAQFQRAAESGLVRLFSLKQEFSSQFQRLLHRGEAVTLSIEPRHFPYFIRRASSVTAGPEAAILVHPADDTELENLKLDFAGTDLGEQVTIGSLPGFAVSSIEGQSPYGSWSLNITKPGTLAMEDDNSRVDPDSLKDIYLLMTYKAEFNEPVPT
jgi:hypothetical protein